MRIRLCAETVSRAGQAAGETRGLCRQHDIRAGRLNQRHFRRDVRRVAWLRKRVAFHCEECVRTGRRNRVASGFRALAEDADGKRDAQLFCGGDCFQRGFRERTVRLGVQQSNQFHFSLPFRRLTV